MAAGGWIDSTMACIRREVRLWLATPQEIFFCLCVPVFWVLVIWALLGDGVMTRVPVGMVDEDNSAMSREVARALDANRAIEPVDFESRPEAMAALRQGSIYGVVAIPFGYSRDMLSGRGSSVVAYLDENRYAVAGTLEAEISSVISALADERVYSEALLIGDGTGGAQRLVSIIHSDFYALGNMQFSFLAFLGSALMPGVIMVGAMLAFLTAILREEWNNHISFWLAAANGRCSAAITGKIIPHFAVYCLIFMFYMAIFGGQGGFAPTGSLLIWFMLGAATLGVFAAMAVLVAAIAPNWRTALVFASGYAAPALPFTGFSIPLDSMGEYVRAFSQCLPLTWLIQGQAQQWTLGADLAHMGSTFFALGLLFIFPAALGYPLFKRRFTRMAEREGHPIP